ncbi:uncharacterized protein SOCE26_002260 [Sorangium cellulosum]|uniref:Uncharacterized protein n=1 Tax=Sorangium cellulosum TaxID=56 RepID=A0A2L0EHT5_SORCE|nr:hypothetical protein [Sorangium cellulosum]AUX38846.1 uncharacterized protein SOCE26_002260 [Sorangium cellulosum]
MNVVFSKKLVLECERRSDLALVLTIDPKNADAVTAYGFESLGQGTCPVRCSTCTGLSGARIHVERDGPVGKGALER